MRYKKCAANAVESSDGCRIGFKGRSRTYFSNQDSTYEISSEYSRIAGTEAFCVMLFIDDNWLIDGESIKSSDLSNQQKYSVINELIAGLAVLEYSIKLMA